ncbi:MAG: hypothetical protein CMP48_16150 [Rickettsiales bacterium]|nr:hypothetical protein [Rickettsiales bacterium]
MIRSLVIFFATALLFTFCSTPEKFKFDELTIVTKDSETLSKWYSQNLGFMDSKDHSLLYHDNLTIKLTQNTEAKHRDSVERAYNVNYLPGIFKFGFKTNQFDGLVDHLKKNNVQFVGSVMEDTILNRRMVIVKDPEANYIQLFEDNGPDKLKPYFLAVISEDIGSQEKWYQVNFPVDRTHLFDREDPDVFIRILRGNDVAIELIQPQESDIQKELDYSQITGFYSIGITGASVAFEKDAEGNLIYNTPKN